MIIQEDNYLRIDAIRRIGLKMTNTNPFAMMGLNVTYYVKIPGLSFHLFYFCYLKFR